MSGNQESGNKMNLLQQQTMEAHKQWQKLIYSYLDDEIYLDDLERVVMQNMSEFNAQLQLVNSILHSDLLVNTLMTELSDSRQIHYYLYAELKSFDKNNEVLSVFYIASGFEKHFIESDEGSNSTKVLKSIALMKQWCLHSSDAPKFKTMVLDRLIDRLFQNPIKEDTNYLMANKYANHVVYTGSEKLRNE